MFSARASALSHRRQVTGDIGLLSATPYAFGIAAMIIVGRSADRSGEGRWHYALAAFVGAAGLAMSAVYGNKTVLTMVGLTLACMGLACLAPVFWSIPTAILKGVAAAVGIALINSLGNIAGFVSSYLVGWIEDGTGSTDVALYVIAGFLVLAGAIVLALPRSVTIRR